MWNGSCIFLFLRSTSEYKVSCELYMLLYFQFVNFLSSAYFSPFVWGYCFIQSHVYSFRPLIKLWLPYWSTFLSTLCLWVYFFRWKISFSSLFQGSLLYSWESVCVFGTVSYLPLERFWDAIYSADWGV